MIAGGTDWLAVGVGLVGSVVVGVVLWLALPRGVVLVKTDRTEEGDVARSWHVRNESALPVRIIEITRADMATGGEAAPVSPSDAGISFDDEVLQIALDEGLSWAELELPPGEGFTVVVPTLNTTMALRYRRAGRWGIFERRVLSLHTTA